jgi:CRISPR-associated protein Cas5d
VSYDVITPLAAGRIFEAVHASPAISWEVERIDVLKPIRFERIEGDDTVGRSGHRIRLLRDVSYLVTAHFVLTASAGQQDNAAKHAQMFRRKARQGRTVRPPHLGLTQYPAHLALVEEASSIVADQDAEARGSADLGWMLFDHGEASGHSRFFEAHLRDGSISVPSPHAGLFAS